MNGAVVEAAFLDGGKPANAPASRAFLPYQPPVIVPITDFREKLLELALCSAGGATGASFRLPGDVVIPQATLTNYVFHYNLAGVDGRGQPKKGGTTIAICISKVKVRNCSGKFSFEEALRELWVKVESPLG